MKTLLLDRCVTEAVKLETLAERLRSDPEMRRDAMATACALREIAAEDKPDPAEIGALLWAATRLCGQYLERTLEKK